MNIQHLERFMCIVRFGSLGRAARALNVTEPALSKSLRQLEESLQVQLLERGARGMTPTLYGESLLRHGRLILGEVETTRREIDELRGASRGTVRVGCRPSFGSTLLPRAIARLQERRPGVTAMVREGFTPNLVTEVIQGNLDFAVVTEATELDPALQQAAIADSPIAVMAGARHPLARKARLSVRDLANAKWILPLKSDPVRAPLDEALKRNGLDPVDVTAESNCVVFTMSYVRQTKVIGFFPRAMIDYGGLSAGLTFLDLPELTWNRQFNIVQRRGTQISPAAQLLVRELRALAQESAGTAHDPQ